MNTLSDTFRQAAAADIFVTAGDFLSNQTIEGLAQAGAGSGADQIAVLKQVMLEGGASTVVRRTISIDGKAIDESDTTLSLEAGQARQLIAHEETGFLTKILETGDYVAIAHGHRSGADVMVVVRGANADERALEVLAHELPVSSDETSAYPGSDTMRAFAIPGRGPRTNYATLVPGVTSRERLAGPSVSTRPNVPHALRRTRASGLDQPTTAG